VARKFSEEIKALRTGPDSLAFISSVEMHHEESYCAKIGAAVVGTNNMSTTAPAIANAPPPWSFFVPSATARFRLHFTISRKRVWC